jgi:hypothetical protein
MRKMLLVVTLIATTTLAAEVVKRGAAVHAAAKAVPLATVLENPSEYSKTPVVVEGVIEKGCSVKGCWIQLAPAPGKAGVRVTFKDYGFFVPLDSKGMNARAEGVTSIKVLPKSEVDHLEGEGAKFKRNPDGSANEVSFIANGIELRKQ